MLTPMLLGDSGDYRGRYLQRLEVMLFSGRTFYSHLDEERPATGPVAVADPAALFGRLAEHPNTVLFWSSKTPLFDTFLIYRTQGDAVLFELIADGEPQLNSFHLSMLGGAGHLVRARRDRGIRRVLLPQGLVYSGQHTGPEPSELCGLDEIPLGY